MTLENKIKIEADEKSQVYYDDRKYVAHTQFSDGARWMLSELKPVMEEMKEALLESEFFMRERNYMFSHSYDKVHKSLSKYNELFKK